MHKFLSTLGLLFVVGVLPGSTTRRQRCTDRSLESYNEKLAFEYKWSTIISAEGDISRRINVNWTLRGIKTSDFDGFLIRMRDGINMKSLAPLQDSDASLEQAWIRANDTTECNDPAYMTTTIDGPVTSSDIYCWCNISSCSFLKDLPCIPWTYFLRHRLAALYVLPNTRTSVTYEAKYHTAYHLEFYQYRREYQSKATTVIIKPSGSCAEDLSHVLDISLAEANRRCCERGILTFSPIDIRKSYYTFDSETNAVNVTISWIPPSTKDFEESLVGIEQDETNGEHSRPRLMDVISQGSDETNITCGNLNRRDSVTAYNLQPNSTYYLHIYAKHSTSSGVAECRVGGCTKVVEVNTASIENETSGQNVRTSTKSPQAVRRSTISPTSTAIAPELTTVTTALEKTTKATVPCPFICKKDGRCGTPRLPVKKIVGGMKAKPFAWPWMGAIWANNTLLCGATLICRSWVITAAHCFLDSTRSKIDRDRPRDLYLGRYLKQGTYKAVKKFSLKWYMINIHQEYDIWRSYNDIALIRLPKPIKVSRRFLPACLPQMGSEPPKLGTKCRVAGWGATMGVGPTNKRLKEATIGLVSPNVCKYAYYFSKTEQILCAGGRNHDPCAGDSGGPLICESATSPGKWELQGIITFGASDCGAAKLPGIYAKVTYYLKWIENVMASNCLRWHFLNR